MTMTYFIAKILRQTPTPLDVHIPASKYWSFSSIQWTVVILILVWKDAAIGNYLFFDLSANFSIEINTQAHMFCFIMIGWLYHNHTNLQYKETLNISPSCNASYTYLQLYVISLVSIYHTYSIIVGFKDDTCCIILSIAMLSVIVHHLCALPMKTEPQCE